MAKALLELRVSVPPYRGFLLTGRLCHLLHVDTEQVDCSHLSHSSASFARTATKQNTVQDTVLLKQGDINSGQRWGRFGPTRHLCRRLNCTHH